MTLLETAAHGGGPTALTVGLIAFGVLFAALLMMVLFGSGRPHTSAQ